MMQKDNILPAVADESCKHEQLDNNSTELNNKNVELVRKEDVIKMIQETNISSGMEKARLLMKAQDLPSEQLEQHWIPCSKGLPKKDGRYQVTRYDYVTNTEFIDILWYEENLWWNRRSTGDYAVTAWMPLPKSYKEEHDG